MAKWQGSPGVIKVVVLDVGETLIDESRIWLRWADRLGVSRMTFLALIGVGIANGEKDFVGAMKQMRPDYDIAADRIAWAQEEPDSLRTHFDAEDLYPDVIPALTELRDLGLKVIISGNQPPRATPDLEAMNLPVDLIRNSADLGQEKPDPAFFAAVVEMAEVPAEQIMYVGDRLDNDVLPAQAAGMFAVLLRRGPWGYVHAANLSDDDAATIPVIDSLTEIPALLGLA
ncbi:MAG: HAD family hydrolase [Promicromonosporaceae bacterium]|nr:HAD family hydrolase [Promicromonosporaceae bacterium]